MNKFLFNYIGKNHPRYNGIICRGGYKCGTDAHLMVVVKSDYPEEYEGKIISKEGILSHSALNFRLAIPGERIYTNEIPLNFKAFNKIYKEYLQHKRETPKDLRPIYAVQFGENLYNMNLVKKFITAAKKIGAKTYFRPNIRRPLFSKNEDNCCVLMPLMPGFEEPTVKIYTF